MMNRIESFARVVERLLSPDTLLGAIAAFFVMLVGAWGSSLLLTRAVRAFEAYGGHDPTALAFVYKLGRLGIWVFAAVIYAHIVPALRSVGTALLASVSVVSVVVGLAAQSTLSNLVAGASLLLYRPFRVGDRIQVTAPTGTELGTVESISLGYTTLRTFDNRRVVMANSTVVNQTTINLTSVDARVQAVIPVSIGYRADLDAARAILMEIAGAHDKTVEVVGCPVVALGPSSVDLSLRVWCASPDDAWTIKIDVLEATKRRFETAQIEIPYPYTNVLVQRIDSVGSAPSED